MERGQTRGTEQCVQTYLGGKYSIKISYHMPHGEQKPVLEEIREFVGNGQLEILAKYKTGAYMSDRFDIEFRSQEDLGEFVKKLFNNTRVMSILFEEVSE
jgi:hypothetical protein